MAESNASTPLHILRSIGFLFYSRDTQHRIYIIFINCIRFMWLLKISNTQHGNKSAHRLSSTNKINIFGIYKKIVSLENVLWKECWYRYGMICGRIFFQ